MWDNTGLPLALVMEEILGWEKKPGQDSGDEQGDTGKDK